MLLPDVRDLVSSSTGFNGHPPLGVNATLPPPRRVYAGCSFNGHPPLGVNATCSSAFCSPRTRHFGFNGHPPLGVNATYSIIESSPNKEPKFQWAPTLGGECYYGLPIQKAFLLWEFQWAPTLGGECYWDAPMLLHAPQRFCFNGHPPLGVNATV